MKKSTIGILAALLTATAVLVVVIISQIMSVQSSDKNHQNKPAAKQQDEQSAEADLTGQTEVTMDIRGYAYSKPNIRVKKGAKVTWTNQDNMEHNVMEAHDDDEAAHEAPLPAEVNPDHFAGPLLKQGQSYSFTFNTAGSFPYHCAPHPYMTGQITVVE